MPLSDRIKRAMSNRTGGCEIPDLARASGVKAPSVHGWLNGSSKSMRAGPAIKAAAYLGVSALWLAEGEGEMRPQKVADAADCAAEYNAAVTQMPSRPDPLIAELIALAEQMNDRGRAQLIERAELLAAKHPRAQAKRK